MLEFSSTVLYPLVLFTQCLPFCFLLLSFHCHPDNLDIYVRREYYIPNNYLDHISLWAYLGVGLS